MRAAAVLIPVLVAFAVTVGIAARRPQMESAIRPAPRLSNVRRRTTRWRWGGVAVGVVLAVGSAVSGVALGVGVMLAAPLFALGVLAGVIVGELRVAAPIPRSASLEVRRVRDYAPRGLGVAVSAAVAGLGLVLVTTTALGSPDDLGRAGRWLVQQCGSALTESRGPWPGSYYSLPLAILVVAGLTAATFALQQVVQRPRQGEDVGVDDALRRHAVAAIVAASGILVTVPLAGVSAIGGIALLGISCPPWWMPVLGWTLLALVPVAAGLAIWCTLVVAVPARVAARRAVG